MTEEEKQLLLEKIQIFFDTQNDNELREFLKENPHLYNAPLFQEFENAMKELLTDKSEENIQQSNSLEELIGNIFQHPTFKDSYDSTSEQIKKSYQLFKNYSQLFDLENELTHELICRLVATTKLRILTDTGNPFREVPAHMGPEVATALGILSFIITQPYFQDLEIENIIDYEPFYSQCQLDDEIGEYYASSHSEGLLKLNSSTYFSHLAELFSLYTTYKYGESQAISHDFHGEILQFLFDYLSLVKVDKAIIDEFKNNEVFMPRFKMVLNEQSTYYHNKKNNPIHDILKKAELLEVGFEKFLMEQVIQDMNKSNVKVKI